MQAKSFLIINALIVLTLVVRLIWARKSDRPTPLHIDSNILPTDILHNENPVKNAGEKSLNCYFQFNGMMLDAFEVLGVPAGSDHDACYRAYVDLRRRISKNSLEVVEHAWEALQKEFRK